MGMKRCGRGLGAWARGLAAAFVLLACLVALPGRAQAVSVDSWDALKGAVGSSDGEPIEVNSALNAGEIIVIEDGDVTVSFAEGSSIERSGSDTTFIVRSGATLTIKGSVTVSGGTGSFVTVEAGGTLNVNGAITADNVNGSASFVDVAGTLSMGGSGAVKNWTTTNSSGDYSAINVHGADATFTMNGGEVSGNIVNAGSNSIEGGAIQLREGATFTMNGGSISGNNVYTGEKPSTVVQGGGIYANASTVKMTGGKISGNMAYEGGGVFLTSDSSMNMTGGSVEKNAFTASGKSSYGGGVYVSGASSLTAENATISGNHALYRGDWLTTQAVGGGIYVNGKGSSVSLTNCTVDGNRAANNAGWTGGGIYAGSSAQLNVTGGSITNNSAFTSDDHTQHESGGGGVYAASGVVLTMSGVKVSGNTALLGAGVYLNGVASGVIESCTISDNDTLRDANPSESYFNSSIGGGLLIRVSGGGLTPPGESGSAPSGVTITGTEEKPTVVSDNTALQGAGGLGVLSGSVTLEHVQVTGNDAPQGGGMWMEGKSTSVTVTSCSFDNNKALTSGGGIGAGGGELKLIETTVDDNTAGEAGGIYNGGAEVTLSSGSISNNSAAMAGGVENGGTFTMAGGDITGNEATSTTDGIGGGVANLGTFTMEGGRIFSNTAAHGANDFYNYSELEDEGGQEGGVVVDPGWDGDHNMGLDSLSDDGASSRAGEQYGTFTLIDPSGFNLGVDGWYEDEPDARYADTAEDQRVKYKIETDDTSEQYLTLGDPVAAGTLTLEPQDIVAYTGGDSMDGDNFPEVRYRVSADNGLTEALKTTDLKLMVDGKAVALDAEEATVGEDTVIIPELGTTFTLESTATGDDEVAGVYDITITGTVTATLSDGRLVKVVVDNDPAAKLTVRTVSNAGDVADETGEAGLVAANPVTVGDSATGAQDATIATATVDAGAKFFTNGDVNMGLLGNGTNGAQISLLFDDLLPSANGSTDDTIAALANRAGIDAETAEFKYLDLINEHDGNAWVSTDSDVTVSWPVPDGVNANEVEFTVYHFQGLHREYGGAGSPDAADQIASCTVETIPCKVVNGRVEFTLDGDAKNGCFSPFALSWGEKSTSGGVDQKPAGDNGDKNDPSMPATGDASFSAAPVLLAGCAVAGLAALTLRRR